MNRLSIERGDAYYKQTIFSLYVIITVNADFITTITILFVGSVNQIGVIVSKLNKPTVPWRRVDGLATH